MSKDQCLFWTCIFTHLKLYVFEVILIKFLFCCYLCGKVECERRGERVGCDRERVGCENRRESGVGDWGVRGRE